MNLRFWDISSTVIACSRKSGDSEARGKQLLRRPILCSRDWRHSKQIAAKGLSRQASYWSTRVEPSPTPLFPEPTSSASSLSYETCADEHEEEEQCLLLVRQILVAEFGLKRQLVCSLLYSPGLIVTKGDPSSVRSNSRASFSWEDFIASKQKRSIYWSHFPADRARDISLASEERVLSIFNA